jgi:cytoskeletal protein CcmA (bactofilin family)
MWNQTTVEENVSLPVSKLPTTNGSATAVSESSSARAGLASGSGEQGGTIGKSLVIKGEVTGSESLYVDGKVEGSINLPGNRVTIGRNGQVAASISAREVVVLGGVVGNVTASDRLDVRKEGSLTGDVVAQRISVEDGAFFKGKIDIRRPTDKSNSETERAGAGEPVNGKFTY